MTMNDSRWLDYPNFKEAEFKCPCGCVSKPMDENLVAMLQAVRTHFAKPVNITSGYRCQSFNDTLQGSKKDSDHIQGKSADFYIAGLTNTLEGRMLVMGFISGQPNFKYAYCNGYSVRPNRIVKYSASWMGSAVHVSVE